MSWVNVNKFIFAIPITIITLTIMIAGVSWLMLCMPLFWVISSIVQGTPLEIVGSIAFALCPLLIPVIESNFIKRFLGDTDNLIEIAVAQMFMLILIVAIAYRIGA